MNYHHYAWESSVQRVTTCPTTSSLPILFKLHFWTKLKTWITLFSRLKKNHNEKDLSLEKYFLVWGKWSRYRLWCITWDRYQKFSTNILIHARWCYDLWEATLSKLTLHWAGTGKEKQLGSSFFKSSLLKKIKAKQTNWFIPKPSLSDHCLWKARFFCFVCLFFLLCQGYILMTCLFFFKKNSIFKTCLLKPNHYFPVLQSVATDSKNLEFYQGHYK